MTLIPAKQLQSGTPVSIGTANNAGSGDGSAKSNHVHDHGAQTTGTHHAAATQSVAGFLSAADKVILDAMTSSVKLNCKLVITTNVTVAGGAPNTVDSNLLTTNVRILVTGQTTVAENGIYIVATVGTGTDGTWTKATDADTTAKSNTGNLVFVWGGAVYAGTLWSLSSQPLGNISPKMVGGSLSSTTPAAIGSATPGTAVTAARGDHVHGHGSQASLSSYHAAAVAGGNSGFLTGTDKTKLDSLAAGQAATLGKVTVDVLLETPTAVTYASTINLDSSIKNDFAIAPLTGNPTINITNPAAGRQGTIWVMQDGTGNRTITWAVSGYTIVKDTLAPDLNPQAAASTLTQYSYAMFTLNGTNYCQMAKSFLS